MPESLSLRRDGAVRRLRLQRAAVHNAFNAGLVAELAVALHAIADDADARVVVLEGKGASFCAGADLDWMRRMAGASEAENRADALALAHLLRTLDELPKPTIARVHGAAFGGGVGLIACCDIAIASDTAKFGLTEARLGLLPATISPYVVNAIGQRNARRWFASAETFDAATALRIGLVHEVVAESTLDAAVQRQIELLLKAGPLASSNAKRLVREVAATHDRDALDARNAELIARLRASPEGREGLDAFLEKRKPGWTDPIE